MMRNSKKTTLPTKRQAANIEHGSGKDSFFSLSPALKALKAVLAYKVFDKHTPLSVTFGTTNRCNFSCQTCAIQSSVKQEIPHDRFMSIIDEVAEAGAIRVSFTGGGEPMMRDDIGELILRAKKNGLIVGMVSNGFFIDKKLDQIRNLDLLLVSYDKSKQHKQKDIPVLDKILENAVLAKNSGIPVCLQSVLIKDTCLHIEDFFSISRQHGLALSLQSLEKWDQSAVPAEIIPSRNEMISAIEKILMEKKSNHNILNSERYFKLLAKYWPQPFHDVNCMAGVFYASVDIDGDLYSCTPLIKQVSAGNLIDQPFGSSFQKLSIPHCPGCLWSCHHELNNIFSMNISALWNLLQFSKNKLVYR